MRLPQQSQSPFGRGTTSQRHKVICQPSGSEGNDRREHGKSLLIVAGQGNVDRIQQLIDAGGDPNYKAKEDDESAFA